MTTFGDSSQADRIDALLEGMVGNDDLLEALVGLREDIQFLELYLHYALPPRESDTPPEDLRFLQNRDSDLRRRLQDRYPTT